jgi:hypothetical protein
MLAPLTMILSAIAGIVCLFLSLIGPGLALLVIAVIAFCVSDHRLAVEDEARQMQMRDLMRAPSPDRFVDDEELTPEEAEAETRREAFFQSLAAVETSPARRPASRPK